MKIKGIASSCKRILKVSELLHRPISINECLWNFFLNAYPPFFFKCFHFPFCLFHISYGQRSPVESLLSCYFCYLDQVSMNSDPPITHKTEVNPKYTLFFIEYAFQGKTFRAFSHSSSHNLLWNTGAGFVGTETQCKG